VLLLPPCLAPGDGRTPLFLRRSEMEAGAVAATAGAVRDGGTAGRASSARWCQRGEGEPAAGVLCFSTGRASSAEERLHMEEEGKRSCLWCCARRETVARGFAYGLPHVSTSSRTAVDLESHQDPSPGAGEGGGVLASLTSSVVIHSRRATRIPRARLIHLFRLPASTSDIWRAKPRTGAAGHG
jgi:hypothetical protein